MVPAEAGGYLLQTSSQFIVESFSQPCPASAAARPSLQLGCRLTRACMSSCLCLQQNFGAALRCAHYLGVSGVLTCHRNSAPLSAAVSKASAGALEVLTVHSSK